jgi:uncharacterized membrane protein YcaP (DUF421 family)
MDWFEIVVGSWSKVARTAAVGLVAYASLVLVLRISGKRTLSKLNAFDLVVTVALGSSLSSTLLSNGTSLLQGLTAFWVLVSMQYGVAWANARSQRLRGWVKSTPRLVFYRGRILDDALARERLTPDEIDAAIRNAGLSSAATVEAVVLESEGPRRSTLMTVNCGALGNGRFPEPDL